MGRKRFIVAGSLIDGLGNDIQNNIYLEIQDGHIAAIGAAADLPGNTRAAIDDFSRCIILPALVDCSICLLRSPSVDKRFRVPSKNVTDAQKHALLERHISYCHAYGVLGLASNDNLVDLSKKFFVGTAQKTLKTIQRIPLPRPDKQVSADDKHVNGDFIKIWYTSDIEKENSRESLFCFDELCRKIQHKGKKKVVVVANGEKNIGEALAAGCDAVEQGYCMGEENLRKIAEKNILWIPGILRAKNALDSSGEGSDIFCRFSQRYASPEGKYVPGKEAFWKKVLSGQLQQLRLARKIGVTTAVGTGAGSIGILHGESMIEEMKLFKKAGFSLSETIRCASENGAGFFGMQELGALTVGARATFLIARGAIHQLPRKLSYLENIYVDGVPSVHYRKNPFIIG